MSKVFIYDEFGPEDTAMMQALYSRSPKSVTEHVEKVRQSGSGKFMETFYVGYGHSSIADCGSTTIFIENISIIGDKAIQDWQLYNGQETSTRYIDMGQQEIIDPLKTTESKKILNNWMDFYINSQEKLQEFLRDKYPRKTEENEAVYSKAIKARCFDIMRGFLPSGITTQLSWHTNLRQAWDHLALLRHHPLPEVRETAEIIFSKLKEKYQNSFSHELKDEQENYRDEITKNFSYFNDSIKEFSMTTTINANDLEKYQKIIESRPEKTGLPSFLNDLGSFSFKFLLDFGSFRDIQRHRNGTCKMPLLTTEIGFNSWYIEQLPDDLKNEAQNLIKNQLDLISQIECSPEIKQYYIAMGFNVACQLTYPLTAAIYVTELRSGRAVHPSLRQIAHKMYHSIVDKLPNLKLHVDLSPDDWDIRRGLADIVQK